MLLECHETFKQRFWFGAHSSHESRPACLPWAACDTLRWLQEPYQLGVEVGKFGGHAGVHAEALDVLQVAGQLRQIRLYHHVDQHRQEVIST